MGLMPSIPTPLPPLGLPWRSLTIPSQDIVLMIFIAGLVTTLLSYLPVTPTKTRHHCHVLAARAGEGGGQRGMGAAEIGEMSQDGCWC